MSETKKPIREYLSSLDKHLPGDDDDLFFEGILDSFGVLEFVAFLEETFHVQFETGDVTLENFSTVNAVVDLIEKLKQESTHAG